MAMFFDGKTDTLSAEMLGSIKWEIRYGCLLGWSEDCAAWEVLIGKEQYGSYSWTSPPAAGSTSYTMMWDRRLENIDNKVKRIIKFRLIDVYQP